MRVLIVGFEVVRRNGRVHPASAVTEKIGHAGGEAVPGVELFTSMQGESLSSKTILFAKREADKVQADAVIVLTEDSELSKVLVERLDTAANEDDQHRKQLQLALPAFLEQSLKKAGIPTELSETLTGPSFLKSAFDKEIIVWLHLPPDFLETRGYHTDPAMSLEQSYEGVMACVEEIFQQSKKDHSLTGTQKGKGEQQVRKVSPERSLSPERSTGVVGSTIASDKPGRIDSTLKPANQANNQVEALSPGRAPRSSGAVGRSPGGRSSAGWSPRKRGSAKLKRLTAKFEGANLDDDSETSKTKSDSTISTHEQNKSEEKSTGQNSSLDSAPQVKSPCSSPGRSVTGRGLKLKQLTARFENTIDLLEEAEGGKASSNYKGPEESTLVKKEVIGSNGKVPSNVPGSTLQSKMVSAPNNRGQYRNWRNEYEKKVKVVTRKPDRRVSTFDDLSLDAPSSHRRPLDEGSSSRGGSNKRTTTSTIWDKPKLAGGAPSFGVKADVSTPGSKPTGSGTKGKTNGRFATNSNLWVGKTSRNSLIEKEVKDSNKIAVGPSTTRGVNVCDSKNGDGIQIKKKEIQKTKETDAQKSNGKELATKHTHNKRVSAAPKSNDEETDELTLNDLFVKPQQTWTPEVSLHSSMACFVTKSSFDNDLELDNLSGSKKTMRILVIGYENSTSRAGRAHPAKLVTERLLKMESSTQPLVPGAEIFAISRRGDFSGISISLLLRRQIEQVEPDAIIFLTEDSERSMLTIESCQTDKSPDISLQSELSRHVLEGMQKVSIPAEMTEKDGAFVCNQLDSMFLGWIRIPPFVPETQTYHTEACMSTEESVKGVLAGIQSIVEHQYGHLYNLQQQ